RRRKSRPRAEAEGTRGARGSGSVVQEGTGRLHSPPPGTGRPRFVAGMWGVTAQPHSRASPQLSKRRAAFHKAFEEVAGREALLGCFSCAWQREVPYHGRLYVSSGHLCFHARSDPTCSLQAIVPVASICALKKTNTALLVPNALSVRTVQGDKVSSGRGQWGGAVRGKPTTHPSAHSSSLCHCAGVRPRTSC
uniref:GRAM domain-containing protein n=1 Tax=Coturnix japonica TaxID=93934 RepID=A0A8C2T2S5_COTJA